MKKLEDMPKNHPFNVPDNYFDKLPGIIQARVAEPSVQQASPYVRYALRYAMPVIALIVVAVLYFMPKAQENTDALLASVSTEQLALYLEDSDLTTDEILDAAELDDESVEAIEAEVYFNDIDLTDVTEFDL
jgi:hypothetical protein